jgi:hypothetical protein
MYSFNYIHTNKEGKSDNVKEIIELLYENKIELNKKASNYEELIKKISRSKHKIPMFDIKSNNIYLIFFENVYERLTYNDYRFIDNTLINSFNINDEKENKMKKFMENYNLKTLMKTYYKIFYDSYAFEKHITQCRRPSFIIGLDHIRPYYLLNEIIYLSLDWELINHKPLKTEINQLCETIVNYDISKQTLIEHQFYSYNNNLIGLIKHYSLFGSYFMNDYLRRHAQKQLVYTNPILENDIKLMIKLISNAPPFDKDFTVYRFIDNDSFLQGYKIGDNFIDYGFISTTRNPFYYQQHYDFGYILMKIKIPKDKKGCALCIESYSNFSEEEEILLPPTSKLRLDKIITDKRIIANELLNRKIIKKYEFTYIDNDFTPHSSGINPSAQNGALLSEFTNADIRLGIRGEVPKIKILDLKKEIINIHNGDIALRLKNFIDDIVNENYLFNAKINNNIITFHVQSYNSKDIYKKFFYYKTSNGVLIYSSHPIYGNINLFIEIGNEIHVNYYLKYSITDSSFQIDLDNAEWIEWFAMLGYYLGIRNIIFYASYSLPDIKNTINEKNILNTRFTYKRDIYEYFKNNKKFYDNILEIKPNFDYYQLDYLKTVNTLDVLKKEDKDELYQIYHNLINTNINVEKIDKFYIYIIHYYPRYIGTLENKIYDLFHQVANPLENISYRLDSWSYLYNRNIINIIPPNQIYKLSKEQIKTLKIPEFKNRLRYYFA